MFSGSTNFVILAVLTLVLKGTWHFRQIVLTVLVVVWGLRLGLFLLMRILQWGEDRRLDEMRENMRKLVVFWTLQSSDSVTARSVWVLTKWCKTAFLFLFPIYSRHLPQETTVWR